MKSGKKLNTTLYDLVKCVDELSSSDKETLVVVKHILSASKVRIRRKAKSMVAA